MTNHPFPSHTAALSRALPPMRPMPRRLGGDVIQRRLVLAFALFGIGAFTATPAQAQLAFELITKAEAGRDRDMRPKDDPSDLPDARTRGVPGTSSGTLPGAGAGGVARPVFAIRIVAPTPLAAVSAPLRIELAFDTLPGTRIVPSTFRVLYGVLKIDLTERLRRFATISERGVVVDQAVVPNGLHRLFIQVADDRGNVAEQELRLRVGASS